MSQSTLDRQLKSFHEPFGERHEELKADLLASLPQREAAPVRRVQNRWLIGSGLAAALAIAAVGWMMWGGGTSLTYAQVQQAVGARNWVRMVYDNGDEQWISLREGRFFYKEHTGRAVFVDRSTNIRHVWRPEMTYVTEDHPVIYPEGQSPPIWTAQTAWQVIVAPMESSAEDVGIRRHSDQFHVERALDTIGERELIRFDEYRLDAIGRRLLMRQMWADPDSRLPVRIVQRLHLADRQRQQRDWISAEYEFPEDGPVDIFDLDVPRGLQIVRVEMDAVPRDAREVIEAARQARDRWPEHWRLVTWSDTESEIDVIYWSGRPVAHEYLPTEDWTNVRIRKERYFNLMPHRPSYHLPMPATADHVLAWIDTQTPVSVNLSDGRKAYSKSGPLPPSFADADSVTIRVSDVRGYPGFNSSNVPTSYLWPIVNRAGPFEIISDAPGVDHNIIVMRSGPGDHEPNYYVDPRRDHVCIRWVLTDEIGRTWREYKLLDLAQLPGGQWYARRRLVRSFGDPDRGTRGFESIWNVDVRVMSPEDFPADVFNGEKLFEEAKAQGATIETY